MTAPLSADVAYTGHKEQYVYRCIEPMPMLMVPAIGGSAEKELAVGAREMRGVYDVQKRFQ